MNSRQRNSSVELLRVICMILIIFHHYSVHGLWGPEDAIISYVDFSWQYLFVQLLAMGGRLACVVFMLVTGYYMISSQVNYKKVLMLIFEMFFYSWGIDILVYGLKLQPLELKTFIKSLFPIFWENWYCVAYIGFCMLIPYINSFLNSLSRERYKKLIITLIVMWSVIPTFIIKSPYFTSNLDSFFIVYAIGGYIKLYGLDGIKKGWNSWLLIFGISTFMLLASVVLIDCVGIILKSDLIFTHADHFMELNKIPAVCVAISMFMIAIEKPAFHNTLINKAATSIIGVYLIHDNTLLRDVIWGQWFPNADYLKSNWIVLHAIIKVVLVFLICLCIDQIRIVLFGRRLSRWIEGKWPIWTQQLKKIGDRSSKIG